MNKSSRSHANFIENKVLCVNVLNADQAQFSNAFASSKLSSEQRFAQGSWSTLATGAPALEDALVSFDCEIAQIQEVGTHTIFICPIVAIRKSQQEQALVYFNRAYHQVGETEPA
jgi:flavin reductase